MNQIVKYLLYFVLVLYMLALITASYYNVDMAVNMDSEDKLSKRYDKNEINVIKMGAFLGLINLCFLLVLCYVVFKEGGKSKFKRLFE